MGSLRRSSMAAPRPRTVQSLLDQSAENDGKVLYLHDLHHGPCIQAKSLGLTHEFEVAVDRMLLRITNHSGDVPGAEGSYRKMSETREMQPYSNPYITHDTSFHFLYHSCIPN